jgi:hypothetical protein
MTDVRCHSGAVYNECRLMSDVTVDLWTSKKGLMSDIIVVV